jgi:hypothetical protein
MASNPTGITIIPTISLFRIRPDVILAEYLRGGFFGLKAPSSGETIVGIKEVLTPSFDSDPDKPIYSCRDTKSGTETIVATTNCRNYEVVNLRGEQPVGGLCQYCRKDFSHASVGIPIYVDTSYDEHGRLLITFFTDGIFHGFRCGLAQIFLFPDEYQDQYPGSETNLIQMYTLMHPTGPPLTPANDYRLHVRNGGSLDDEKWETEEYRYVQMPNITISPIKRNFVRVRR